MLALALALLTAATPAAASDSVVFVRDSDPPGSASSLQVLAPVTGTTRKVFAFRERVFDIDVSPDGDQVAYVTLGRPGDQIRVVGTDGKGDRGLVSGSDVIDNVSWTPDGSRLIYSAGPFDRRGNRQLKRSEIYRVAVEGGEPERLTRDQLPDFDPTVTPDGERIVYSHAASSDEPKLDRIRWGSTAATSARSRGPQWTSRRPTCHRTARRSSTSSGAPGTRAGG